MPSVPRGVFGAGVSSDSPHIWLPCAGFVCFVGGVAHAPYDLVILAAGMGSRFGGLKQVQPVGPHGELIIEYSAFDALRAGGTGAPGFGRVVLVIRRDTEAEFRASIGRRLESRMDVSYVYQELDALPAGYAAPVGRTKPWGTGHAVLVAREAVRGPFAVIVEEARPALLDPNEKAVAFFPRVGGRQTGRGAWSTRFTKRGDHVLDGLALETRFPFGLIARRIEIAAPQQVLVLPAVFALEGSLLARANSAEGVARRLLLTEERRDVVRSLRDYRAGDHPRSIHWRASAHRGSLVVKDFEKTEPQRALVVLDTWMPSETVGRDAVMEDAISLAASLLVAYRERGMKTGVVFASGASFQVFMPERGTSTARLHAALARLVPPGAPELGPLAHQARRASDRARVVVVTTRSEQAARDGLAGLETDLFLALEKPGDVARFQRQETQDGARNADEVRVIASPQRATP